MQRQWEADLRGCLTRCVHPTMPASSLSLREGEAAPFPSLREGEVPSRDIYRIPTSPPNLRKSEAASRGIYCIPASSLSLHEGEETASGWAIDFRILGEIKDVSHLLICFAWIRFEWLSWMVSFEKVTAAHPASRILCNGGEQLERNSYWMKQFHGSGSHYLYILSVLGIKMRIYVFLINCQSRSNAKY